jgi:phospholipid/cholesterol/gamma-HCH transport system permease protein
LAAKKNISIQTIKDELHIKLEGDWRAKALQEIDFKLQEISTRNARKVLLDLEGVVSFDTTSAWVLHQFIQRLESQKIKVSITHAQPQYLSLLEQVKTYSVSRPSTPQKAFFITDILYTIGKTTTQSFSSSYTLLSFLGEVTLCILKTFLFPLRFRFSLFCTFVQRVGVEALPIVGLISFLIGVVLTYQSADQLRRFGAEIFTVDLLAISVLREIGILLTAIVVAGRSGSSFAAQIGFMKLNQEIDAMVVLAMNPLDVLVLPRIFSLVFILPFLAFYADVMALLGGALMSLSILDLSFDQFFHQFILAIGPWTFWVGIIKAPFFAFVIGLIGCFEGMRVQGGARSVGIHTTKAVVESIFLVIIFDAAFSILFSYLKI